MDFFTRAKFFLPTKVLCQQSLDTENLLLVYTFLIKFYEFMLIMHLGWQNTYCELFKQVQTIR